MYIRIEQKESFKVAGVKARSIEVSKCPEIWDDLFRKASLEDLGKLGDGKAFGICFEINDGNKLNYMASYDLKDEVKAKELGLEILEIPAAEYAIVKLKGAVPKSIQEGWKYVFDVFFLEQRYKHAGTPDLEVYTEVYMCQPDYEMELWVPIVKVH